MPRAPRYGMPEPANECRERTDLAGQLPEEFPLIHPVLEGFPAVDEHYRHFVIELSPQFIVGIYIHFLPGKTAAARELHQALLHHLAKMTSFARVNHDLAGLWHDAIVSLPPHPLAREKKRTAGHEWSYQFGNEFADKTPGVESENDLTGSQAPARQGLPHHRWRPPSRTRLRSRPCTGRCRCRHYFSQFRPRGATHRR